MQKLEDIDKKNIFKVPEGYFEELPSIIHSRVSKPSSQATPWFTFALRYALPACVFILAVVWYYNNQTQSTQTQDVEEMLASIDTNSLIEYLDEREISLNDLLDTYEVTMEDVDEIETIAYPDISDEDFNIMLNPYDLELNN